MIINKDGKVVANISQPLIAFETEDEYTDWKDNLPDPSLEKYFLVVKKYLQGPGIMQITSIADIDNYPVYGNTLYIDQNAKTLYYYDYNESRFIKLTSGEAT